MKLDASIPERGDRLYGHDIVAKLGKPGRIHTRSGTDIEDCAWCRRN